MNELRHSPLPEDEDRRLEMLFRPAASPVADDGFSATVMRRVARRAWRRRLLLTTAGAAGLVVAWQPVWTIAVLLGQALAQLGSRWPELAWVLQSPWAIAAGLLLVAAPGVLRWLEE
jgi:hypothetical protein